LKLKKKSDKSPTLVKFKLKKMTKKPKPTILAILDGWGIGPKDDTNAIWLAKTPVFDYLKEKYPFTQLGATGKDVGLDNHQTSGSETGHMNIGA